MSSDNKFALLASLTASSLPPTGDSSNQILSSNEGSQNNSDSDDNDNGEVVFMQDPVDDGQGIQKKANDLLSASGLLTGSGGGLFDEVDKEEEQERERARMAELERKEQEELRAKQEAEAQRQLQLEQKQAQEAREAMEREMRQEQMRQQQIQQENMNNLQPNLNVQNGMGVDMGIQNLSLQEAPQQHQMGISIGMPHQAPTYSNATPMGPNSTSQTHSNVAPFVQNGVNQSYSNASPMTQNGADQVAQQIPQTQPPIQQAGFGGSYYYSTSGNVQQKFNSPHLNPSVGASMASPNPTSFTLSPGVNRHDNSKLLGPETKGGVPPHTNSMASTSSSYAVRSQMRHVNSPPRTNMPTGGAPPPIPNINGQQSASSQNPPVPADIPQNVTSIQQYDPSTFKPTHGVITISDPILVQSPGVFSGPPYWTYAVTVRDVNVVEGQEDFSKVVSSVRRRFRHFVALEERLRADRPGSILPPRPEKHSTRALNEATATQSPQFALQRASELEIYLNALRLHPYAGSSNVLSLFLTLPDHLGVAWPEVSSSIFTRLSEVGTNTAVKVAEGTSAVLAEMNHEHSIMAGEDNSELLQLAASEGIRIGGVLQAVPKLEGGVSAFANLSTLMSTNGLELQKLVNQAFVNEKEVAAPFEILANGLLRSARRTNRLAVELAAANQVFQSQYKLCKYERLAFADRRSALARRREARKEADIKARKLAAHQHAMSVGTGRYLGNGGHTAIGTPYGQSSMAGAVGGMGYPMTDKVEMEAAVTDEFAAEAIQDADVVGRTLMNEVERIAKLRRTEWSVNLRIMASSMREAHTERIAIWEGCKTAFLNEFQLSDQLEQFEGSHTPGNDNENNTGLPELNGNGMAPIAEDGVEAYQQAEFQNEHPQQNFTQLVS